MRDLKVFLGMGISFAETVKVFIDLSDNKNGERCRDGAGESIEGQEEDVDVVAHRSSSCREEALQENPQARSTRLKASLFIISFFFILHTFHFYLC